jgi:hypothetical protein
VRSSKDKTGYLIMAVVAAVTVAIFVVKANLGSKLKAGADNCVGEVVANTVIVLDYSEQITDQTRDEISARAFAHIHDKVKVNERVSVFAISDISKKSLKPLVSICRPPDEGNRAIENVQLIHKRFQQNFEKPLREVLSNSSGDSKESPIAQALTDLSLSQYLRGQSNTLLVFSDMLEHTSKFSLYKCSSANRTIALYRESRTGAMERPEFKNTSVKLHLIPRLDEKKETLQCRDQLWPWFFGNNKGAAASLSVEYLPGGVSMGSNSSGVKK